MSFIEAKKPLLIFDLDGTLVKSGGQITDSMLNILEQLNEKEIELAIVTGGQYHKVKWQLRDRTDLFKYIFPECGALVYIDDKLVFEVDVFEQNQVDQNLLEQVYQVFVDQCEIRNIKCMGNRIDPRSGLIYLTPVGMGATDELREPFIEFENKTQFRLTLIEMLKEVDTKQELDFVTGGKTGITIYPRGVDKTQVIPHLALDKEWHFFGDNCGPDGNDRPLYVHPTMIGHEVVDFCETERILTKLFL